ncbi:MAG: hypothetical protein KDB79_10410, partial [Acidobacteria bacterium]|nr:hypothetical protein [Acidobacteriota bacterium]
MFNQFPFLKYSSILLPLLAVFLTGCIKVKTEQTTPTLLSVDDADQGVLFNRINYLAKVNSINAQMYLEFRDNSFAPIGLEEKYQTADSTIVVQRPENINLKVEVPFIGTDIAQMTSNGDKFRVAILQDGAGGKYRTFLVGSNRKDYSILTKTLDTLGTGDSKEIKKNVNAFSNLRPQHFTDAMLIRPTDIDSYIYTMSTVSQEEFDIKADKKSPLRWVLRGYYLLDEYRKEDSGKLTILRRFWFDRVGGINLSRQQIFDARGEIESDIVYGKTGPVTETGEYNLPLEVEVTRPKEKYKIKLKYKAPAAVKIGKIYPATAFLLENTRNLREVDLDKQLLERK